MQIPKVAGQLEDPPKEVVCSNGHFILLMEKHIAKYCESYIYDVCIYINMQMNINVNIHMTCRYKYKH